MSINIKQTRSLFYSKVDGIYRVAVQMSAARLGMVEPVEGETIDHPVWQTVVTTGSKKFATKVVTQWKFNKEWRGYPK